LQPRHDHRVVEQGRCSSAVYHSTSRASG
jgi:hypothetical protein